MLVVGPNGGLFADYYKGTVELVVMCVVDMVNGIPAPQLVLTNALFFGNSVWNIVIGMALVL